MFFDCRRICGLFRSHTKREGIGNQHFCKYQHLIGPIFVTARNFHIHILNYRDAFFSFINYLCFKFELTLHTLDRLSRERFDFQIKMLFT